MESCIEFEQVKGELDLAMCQGLHLLHRRCIGDTPLSLVQRNEALLAASGFILQQVSADCVLLDDDMPESCSSNRLDGNTIFGDVNDPKEPRHPSINLVVRKVLSIRHLWRDLIVKLYEMS